MDEATAQAWQQAANSVQNTASVIATGNLNKRTRDWNEYIMGKQRDWAIQDRDYANQYNSPQEVMARAKAAGINPMYAATNGNVITASSPVRSVESASWHPQVPEFKEQQSIMPMINMQLMQAQLENVKSQNANINADTALKLKNASNVDVSTDIKSLDLSLRQALYSTRIGQEVARQAGLEQDVDVKKQSALNLWENANYRSYQLQYLHDENARREALTSANIGQAVQRILLMQQQTAHTRVDIDRIGNAINLMEKDQQMKDFIIELNKSNLTPNDPVYLRIVDGLLKTLLK